MSWLCAFVFAIPQLFIFVQVEEAHPATIEGNLPHGTQVCKSAGYTAEWQRKGYITFLAAYILVAPAGIMVFCYANIVRVLWLRVNESRSPSQASFDLRQRVSTRGAGADALPARYRMPRSQRHQPSTLRRAASCQPCHSVDGPSQESRFYLSSKRAVVKMTILLVTGFVLCWTPYFTVSLVRVYSDYQIELNVALSVSELLALAHSAFNPLLFMVYNRRAVRTFLVQMCGVQCMTATTASRPPNRIDHPVRLNLRPPGVHGTRNGRDDGGHRRSTAGGGAGDVGHIGGARSAPCHMTRSGLSNSRSEAFAAIDYGPYQRHRLVRTH